MKTVKRLDALTSLRFFAALVVVLGHCGGLAFASMPFWFHGLMQSGYQMVRFFFVLSGFVLAYSSYTPGDKAIRNGAIQFWKNRFARIYPAYFLALLIALPVFLHGVSNGGIPRKDAFLALTFVPLLLQSWGDHDLAAAINIPAWSLSVEMFFYALFPMVIRIAAAHRSLFLLGACGLVYLDKCCQVWHDYWPPNHLGSFAAGVIAGLWFRESTLQPKRAALYLTAVTVIGLLCFQSRLPAIASSPIVLVPLFAVLITVAASCAGNLKFLESKLLVLLGDASYSLYILHWPVWYLYISVLRRMKLSEGEPASLGLFLVAIVALSIACYTFVETPSRKRILKMLANTRELNPQTIS